MNDPIVGVILERDRHPAAKAFGDLLDEEIAGRVLCDDHVPLSEALSKHWDKDAHLILYSLRDEDDVPVFARASKRSSLAAELIQHGGRIAVSILVFDHDLPGKAEWTEEGLGEFVQGLAQADLPSPTYWYPTLHGSRFIYVLTKPVDHLRAEAYSHTILAQFKAAGIVLDPSCVDWTRLFRLPHTVREDTGLTYECEVLGPGDELDPDSIEINVEVMLESFAEVRPYEGDMPGPDDVRGLLVTKSETGKDVATDWAKTAKTYLRGRESYPICFEDALIDPDKYGGRNNAITKLAGQIVGMTARQETASPEGIFALLYGALEQLCAHDPENTDWHRVAWDIIARMWANEQSQIEASNREREAGIQVGRGVREEIVQKIKQVRPDDLPDDPKEADAALKQRMIASDGKLHWVMRQDGGYNVKPVGDSMLVPMIKELGMSDVIEIHEMVGKSWRVKSSKALLDEHATPIITVRCSSREPVAFIEGAPGYRTLHLPVHRLNPLVTPVFSAAVDGWLRVLFGDKYDLGIEWMSWSLEVGAPICALNLYGAPGAGKGLFVQGLAECFEGERLNDGRVMGKFNEGLLHTPVINCDEGVPSIKSDEALALDQAFRSFVSGGSITIRSMFMNPFTANIYPRIVFTSNDRDILKSIIGHRDLTDDDIRAIELRLLSICIKAQARDFLTAKGNYSYTAGWVHGKSRSNYTLANHIRWLHEHRKPSVYGTGRLLVEGEVGTTLVREMRLRSAGAQTVLRSLVKMIERPHGPGRGMQVTKDGRVFVTPSGLVDFSEHGLTDLRERITLPRASQVLRQFSAYEIEGTRLPKVRPAGVERGRWVEIDLGLLLEETEQYGMGNSRIISLLMLQPDGAARVALAKGKMVQHD